MNIKKYLSKLIRSSHLADAADRFRFHVQAMQNRSANKKFVFANPAIKFPPPYFLYETYELNYKNYYNDGLQTATEIVSLIQLYTDPNKKDKAWLDWGCGPGRVVRHLPKLLPGNAIYGCDYNAAYVDWCSKNLPNISFVKNELIPPTSFGNDIFDVVYGLSIITHLSEKNHHAWLEELRRILKPGGILLITSQGDQFKEKLLPNELEVFNKGGLVVRETEQEGHRVFAAFQSEKYMRNLVKEFTVITFIPGGTKESIHGKQDTWLLRK